MTVVLSRLILVAALAATPAGAQTPSPTKPAKPEKICREGGEQPTGSHIRTGRRCLTADQWEIEDRRDAVKPLTMQVNEARDGVGKPPR